MHPSSSNAAARTEGRLLGRRTSEGRGGQLGAGRFALGAAGQTEPGPVVQPAALALCGPRALDRTRNTRNTGQGSTPTAMCLIHHVHGQWGETCDVRPLIWALAEVGVREVEVEEEAHVPHHWHWHLLLLAFGRGSGPSPFVLVAGVIAGVCTGGVGASAGPHSRSPGVELSRFKTAMHSTTVPLNPKSRGLIVRLAC